MSDYNLLLQHMSEFWRSGTHFIIFIPRPVTTGFLRFFAVLVHGSWILKLSGTGPVRGPSKKGNRTETRPDFKALNAIILIFWLTFMYLLNNRVNSSYLFYDENRTNGFALNDSKILFHFVQCCDV